MASEGNKNQIIISNTGGLVRRMDYQLELMNRVLGKIAERKTEIIASGNSFLGMMAGAEREWEIAPGVRIAFCWCPPGDFIMGSPETEEGRRSNESQVKVMLTKGFWMAKTQVTHSQWQAVMGSNPSSYRGENLPMETVSWDDAQEFLAKINTLIGSDEGGNMVLPTEAQWEYECRAGETGPYSGGTIDEVAWYIKSRAQYIKSRGKTHFVATYAVGTKKANAWGLHDMHGNVWEWCNDWYESELCGGVDPRGANSGTSRVIRGGSWFNFTDECRAANRSILYPSSAESICGFRVARCSVHQ